jgi:hypothetical protein
MAEFKTDINKYVNDYSSTYNAGKASMDWYDTARGDRKDNSVERVLQTEYFEAGKYSRNWIKFECSSL